MKLFAPRNYPGGMSWDYRDPGSGWTYVGSLPTSSGIRVSEDSALEYSPVMAATRLISEAVASLPAAILEQVDYRTTRKATDHPLWRIIHDVPNPEQDKVTWFDMQVAFQCNRGNAYAEIARDGEEIIALWPIHPTRIPLRNITRNPSDPSSWHQIIVGEPGEIVYWVRNDDGSLTPIPKSDMLHVPGILSTNGITGQSIVQYAANEIGIGLATEEHAGSYFKNGASFNLALTTDKSVSKEAAERLRQSWQTTYAGSRNSYKAIILEDGFKPVPLSNEPEKSQLTLSRQFNIGEIARYWKVPPHMLGDMSQATFSNIEQQYLEFVIHSLGYWVVKWEAALNRQLLTEEEQKRYHFKFNLNWMLRGDTAARSAFYQSLFQMGVISPNDIRELEDWNPVPGGDQRFVPGNNLIPLEKATELAQANIDKLKAPPPAPPAAPASEPNTNIIPDLIRLELRDVSERFSSEIKCIEEKRAVSVEKVAEKLTETASGLEKVASSVDVLGERMEKEHDATVEMLVTQNIATREQSAADAMRVIETMIAVPRALADAVQPLTEATASLPQVLSDAVKPQIEAAEALKTLISAEIHAQNAKIDALPAEIVANLPAPVVPEPVIDTQREEAVAVRESKLQEQAEAMALKREAEREAADRIFALALRKAIDALAAGEAKAIFSAREQPKEFAAWRAEYYSRFVRHFEANLTDFQAEAGLCGIVLDLRWAADRYAQKSISDLKTTDGPSGDNHYDRVKELTDNFVKLLWTDRSRILANEMIERGRRLFKEQLQ